MDGGKKRDHALRHWRSSPCASLASSKGVTTRHRFPFRASTAMWQYDCLRRTGGWETRQRMTRFDTTRWSMVVRARGESRDARDALGSLCRAYRPPVVAYIRSRGHNSDAAEDLAQTFFAHFLEDAYHTVADPARGRFRAFLLTALKRFLINADAEAHALKRGGGVRMDVLADEMASGGDWLVNSASPERAFERSWAIAVLDAAMTRLRAEAVKAGKSELFDQLREFLTERPDEADYARAAAALNLRRNTLAVAVHRLRHRLRELVREELAQTTTCKDDLDAELRELRATLSGSSAGIL
jgi:DNA-directed RNA polymerase specialized sigma24 family protein